MRDSTASATRGGSQEPAQVRRWPRVVLSAVPESRRPADGLIGATSGSWENNRTPGRVGAYLAVGSPPGTVRAPLDAYGSTLETAERHICQRGQFVVAPEPAVQGGLRPPEDKAQVVPVVVPTSLPGDNVMENEV